MVKVYTHTERIGKLREAAKKVTANRESRLDFLHSIGVYDKRGNFAAKYR